MNIDTSFENFKALFNRSRMAAAVVLFGSQCRLDEEKVSPSCQSKWIEEFNKPSRSPRQRTNEEAKEKGGNIEEHCNARHNHNDEHDNGGNRSHETRIVPSLTHPSRLAFSIGRRHELDGMLDDLLDSFAFSFNPRLHSFSTVTNRCNKIRIKLLLFSNEEQG